MKKAIYLDHHATTPVDPQVFEVMAPYFCEHFGNASSASHSFGWKAEMAVSKARKQIADLIGAKSSEIFFTSGATESNNWALMGLYGAYIKDKPGEPVHIITSNAEHSSNLAVFKRLSELDNVELTIIEVNKFGQIDFKELQKKVQSNTLYMSFIFGNNEIGSLNPIAEIGELAKEKGIYFHTDGAQCAGRVEINVEELKVDLLSLASHKMYGPKGVGALYIRSHDPKISMRPFFEGGGQEKGLRSGTLNVPGIVGMGEASRIAKEKLTSETERLCQLRSFLFEGLRAHFPEIQINGHPEQRLPNNLNVTIPELKLERLLPELGHIAVSSGSACASGSTGMSHVLQAIGLTPEQAKHSLRFGLGRSTTEEELKEVIESFAQGFEKQKETGL